MADARKIELQCLVVTTWPSSRADDHDAALTSGLAELGRGEPGRCAYSLMHAATERQLTAELASLQPSLLCLIAECQQRAQAHYASITLLSELGAGRGLHVGRLGSLLVHAPSVKLVVLMSREPCGAAVSGVAQTLAELGVGAVIDAGDYSASKLVALFAPLTRAILDGRTIAAAFEAAGSSVALHGERQIALFGKGTAERLVPASSAPVSQPEQLRSPMAASTPQVAPVDPQLVRRRRLAAKRERGEFDVFLSYSRADESAVKQLGVALEERGILPWLDQWELRPGVAWQPELERIMATVGAAAVCVGSAGPAPWQDMEIQSLLRRFVKKHAPIIPVLLPGAGDAPELPDFLGNFTWVDFRRAQPDPLAMLCWGITGVRPDDQVS